MWSRCVFRCRNSRLASVQAKRAQLAARMQAVFQAAECRSGVVLSQKAPWSSSRSRRGAKAIVGYWKGSSSF